MQERSWTNLHFRWLWVEKFLGKWWGFLTGISFALGYVITGATCGIAIGKFTCYWFPSLDSQVWTMIFALGFNLIIANSPQKPIDFFKASLEVLLSFM